MTLWWVAVIGGCVLFGICAVVWAACLIDADRVPGFEPARSVACDPPRSVRREARTGRPVGANLPGSAGPVREHRVKSIEPYLAHGETLYEVRCDCSARMWGLPSRAACVGWVVTHAEVERSLAPFDRGAS